MTGLRSRLAVAAAVLACALGVAALPGLGGHRAHRPEWAAIVASLASAPIAANAVTALDPGPRTSPEQATMLLREAAWQRPDLRWALASELPASLAPAAIVTVGDAAAPAGWHRVWRADRLRLWVPDRQ